MAFGLAWLGVAFRHKPLLSDKVISNDKVTLLEDGNIVENDKNAAFILNELFFQILQQLLGFSDIMKQNQ